MVYADIKLVKVFNNPNLFFHFQKIQTTTITKATISFLENFIFKMVIMVGWGYSFKFKGCGKWYPTKIPKA